ncbi:hypothetical protein GDO81_026186 [Engystomops pustulosus]|uniref:Uncharacterized protein n=1 Tax=Engystomops pustulosus TaxID=76066 RepID=A0AAV6YMU8_ENGPU|nr:hypothetical protein GDO81_026186 [Engystomops pustulosus]
MAAGGFTGAGDRTGGIAHLVCSQQSERGFIRDNAFPPVLSVHSLHLLQNISLSPSPQRPLPAPPAEYPSVPDGFWREAASVLPSWTPGLAPGVSAVSQCVQMPHTCCCHS